MSTDNPVLAAVEAGLPNSQKPRRGWFRRNWLWFVPTLLLAMMLLCVVGFFGFIECNACTLCNSDLYKKAMQKVMADTKVQNAVGQPLTLVKWPLPYYSDTETDLEIYCDLNGPKGVAKMHVRVRKNVGNTELKVKLPGNTELTFDLSDGKNVAAPYQQPKAGNKKSQPNGPPPEVDLDVPDDAAPASGR
jgi:hypothetical protein